MWKFQEFSAICYVKSALEVQKVSKLPIFANILTFKISGIKNSSKSKFRASEEETFVVFERLESQKLISRKIWVGENF